MGKLAYCLFYVSSENENTYSKWLSIKYYKDYIIRKNWFFKKYLYLKINIRIKFHTFSKKAKICILT